jgi:hypothetical protein
MNKHTVRYFDTITGSEIGAARAFDRDGVLRDGFTMRVPMRFRDAGTGSHDAKPQFTDGHNIVDPAAGLKPGYRMPVVQDRTKVHDAYAKADRQMRNRYKCGDQENICEDCDGEGYDEDGDVCDTCNGTGVMPEVEAEDEGTSRFGSNNDPDPASDSRTLDRHHQMMDRLYRERDAELQNAWRRR